MNYVIEELVGDLARFIGGYFGGDLRELAIEGYLGVCANYSRGLLGDLRELSRVVFPPLPGFFLEL